jgi:3-hydroxybutyryl-CoA dehydrogenase
MRIEWRYKLKEAFYALDEEITTAKDIDKGMVLGCNHQIGT